EVNKLGSPASKGCVRIAPKNAAVLFALVKEHGMESTKIVLTGPDPYGDVPMAAAPPTRAYPPRAYNPWFEQPEMYRERPRRRGLFGWRGQNNRANRAQRAPRGYYQPRGVAPWGY
ncbi:MAG: L,D-transpeptidase, partial [Methyloceanibacter sp.]